MAGQQIEFRSSPEGIEVTFHIEVEDGNVTRMDATDDLGNEYQICFRLQQKRDPDLRLREDKTAAENEDHDDKKRGNICCCPVAGGRPICTDVGDNPCPPCLE